MQDGNRILTRKQAAERLGVSERTLDRLCDTDSGLKKLQLSTRRVGLGERNVEAYVERITQAS
jgi:predicted DNA-binding transcriptional regulator AlpA